MVVETPPTFEENVLELIRLVAGLESAHFECKCLGRYRIGIADDLRKVLRKVEPEALKRTNKTPEENIPNTTRFTLLEVDD